MARRLLVLAVLLPACLPRIPDGRPAPELPAAQATAKLCRLTSEKVDRVLLLGIDAFSFAPWHQCIGSVVVQRPDGMLVIDPGIGLSIQQDLARSSLLSKLAFGSGNTKVPVVSQMDAAGIDPLKVRWVALTHAHWDHTGAIRDLSRSKILLSRTEFKTYRNLKGYEDKGAMQHHLAVAEGRYAPFEFDGPPLLGFPSSHDLFGDGSVVAVPTPGHTPGSTSYLVRGDDGKNWLFVGDAAWAFEGVKRPAHKNPLVSLALDADAVVTAQTMGQLHAVQSQRPEVQVVPAHDFDTFALLPECAKAP